MSGYGEAKYEAEGLSILVRAISTNGRFLQLTTRLPELFAPHEAEVEAMLRSRFSRGSVVVAVEIQRSPQERSYKMDTAELARRYGEILELQGQLRLTQEVPLATLLSLPGVFKEVPREGGREGAEVWEAARGAVIEAVDAMEEARAREGRDIRQALTGLLDGVDALASRVETSLGAALLAYKERIGERVRRLLEMGAVTVDPGDVAREVALLGERGDVSEELQRLRMHVRNFREQMAQSEAGGRKLEFISQEMAREAATLSAKMVEPSLLKTCLELRSEVEKIREQVRNVE